VSRATWVLVLSVLLVGSALGLPLAASESSPGSGAVRLLVDAEGGVPLAPVPASAAPVDLPMTVSLEPRDATGLAAFDAALTGPHPPAFLTEREFEQRFSPSATNITALEQFFAARGGSGFSVSADRLSLRFTLSTPSADAAFATDVVGVGAPSDGAWAWVGSPTLPAAIAPMVYGVGGLARSPTLPSVSLREVHEGPRSGLGTYVIDANASGVELDTGSDYTQAYGENRLFPGGSASGINHTFATGQAVATILMSGYNATTQANLPPWDPSQISDYFNDTFPSDWPTPHYAGVPVTVDNVTPPAPGSYGNANDTTFDEAENSLDIEMAGSAAPGATVVNFYFAASVFENTPDSAPLGPVADDFAAALAAALAYNYSGARLDSVTNSFALPDLNDSAWNLELMHAAATGVTVVAASGDQGNAPSYLSGRFQGQWPGWPSTAAFASYGTMAVGGVSVSLLGGPSGTWSANGPLPDQFDPNVTGLASQTAWYDGDSGGNLSGSEGGLSTVIPEPGWQFDSAAQPAISVAGGLQGATFLGRATPDVAFPANDTIAYVAHDANGTYFGILEGTSIASPFFAGLLAEWSAVANHSFGWLDPALYRMAGYYAANVVPGDPFLDVTTGGNYIFSAAPGWDATTGWGGLAADEFLGSYQNSSVRGFNYTGPTPGLPPPLTLGLAPPTPVVTYLLIFAGVLLAVALVALVVWDERVRRQRVPPTGPYQAPPWAYGPPPPANVGSGVAPPPGTYPGAIPPPPPFGAPPPPPPHWAGPPPPATFACPYCGALRPAEPVRCPGCGAF
jgi:subtilase family serine protease